MILLRVVSAMTTDEVDVNIVPEFPIAKATFSGSLSFGGLVDLLLTKLPSRFTREITNLSYHSVRFLTFSLRLSPSRSDVSSGESRGH